MANENSVGETNLLELATELTIAWLANPNTRASADEVPAFLEKMHGAVAGLVLAKSSDQPEAAADTEDFVPAVSVRKSLASKDHIISLIDGKPYKTLKRHLAGHGLTPAEYRARYNLRADYPMVAENYGAMRREMAKTIGLGRRPKAAGSVRDKSAAAMPPAKAAPKRMASAKKSAAAAKPAGKRRAPTAEISAG